MITTRRTVGDGQVTSSLFFVIECD
jgi:hypothetical protein